MYVLRQLASSVAPGAFTDPSAAPSYIQQVVDVPSRYIMQLAAPGKFSSDFTQVAASASFTVPLPQAYDTTQQLFVALASDQTIKVTWSSTGLGVSNMMLRAGLATDQNGVLSFCGQTLSLQVTNSAAVAANIEWFLFELPNIASTTGWRDGSLSTGVLGPSGSSTLPPNPIPTPATAVGFADSAFYDYSGGTVTNAGWTQIKAATAALINYIVVQDTGGIPVYLGVGAMGSEVIQLQVPLGGVSGQFALTIPAGARLSLKAATAASIASGTFLLNGFT